MKKILWLCNMVLPDFCDEFGLRYNGRGSWMTGMLHAMEGRGETDIALCFPVIDEWRLKSGNSRGHRFYSFPCNLKSLDYVMFDGQMVDNFIKIIDDFKPELVHIWGTEFPHALAMIEACEKKGLLERVVVNIQGLVSIFADSFTKDIPVEYHNLQVDNYPKLKELQNNMFSRGLIEVKAIRKVKHVIGRTQWDKACVMNMNSNVHYHYCNEILRSQFYQLAGNWDYEKCNRHTIFCSQMSSPRKGFHKLLQAMPYLVNQFPGVHVYVGGTNILQGEKVSPYAKYIKELIENYELQPYITFLGNLDEGQMIEQYLRANVYVSASIMENESNSLSEARMIGVPSVSSFVGGVTERINSNVDGFLYPYAEENMLAYYIKLLFENKDNLCEKFSRNASKMMSVINNPTDNASKNLKIYEKIINNSTFLD